MGEFTRLIEQIAKSGEITPGALNIGGELKPQDATKLIDLVVKENEFLKEVTVEQCSRLKKDVDVWEIADRILVRQPEGQDPKSYTGIENTGKTLHLLDVQLFARLTFSFLRDNRHKPNLESQIVQRFARKFGEELVLLGFEGEGEDGSEFKKLNKGYIKLAEEATASKKVAISDFTYAGGNVDWHEVMKAMIEEMPDKYKSKKCTFIMNKSDYEEYVWQYAGMDGGIPIITSGKADNFLGYPIRNMRSVPKHKVLFVPLPNMVFGMGLNIERYREVKASKRCIDYTFVMWCDYEFAVDEAVVLAK